MRTFFQYYYRTPWRPTQTFGELLTDPRRLRFGWHAILINMFLYTWVYINLTIGGGAPSSFAPWLAIPKESYYFYDRFLVAPSMFICWIPAVLVGVLGFVTYQTFVGKATLGETLVVEWPYRLPLPTNVVVDGQQITTFSLRKNRFYIVLPSLPAGRHMVQLMNLLKQFEIEPRRTEFYPPFPNPFHQQTIIPFKLQTAEQKSPRDYRQYAWPDCCTIILTRVGNRILSIYLGRPR